MDTEKLKGRSALVTGGSRGIGLMLAQGLAAAGADVYITARKADALQAAAEQIGDNGHRVTTIGADLSGEEGWAAVADALSESLDKLDVLFNNAGAAWGGAIDEHPPAAFDKVFSVNVKGVFALTQRLLPLLRAGASPDDPGRVVNMGSIDGVRVSEFDNFAYTSSKAAVHMLTRQMASKLAKEHITVNAIAPGPFPSKMMAHIFNDEQAKAQLEAQIPLGRAGRAEDIAALAVFMSSGPGSAYMTGAIIPLDGGFNLV
jgi:NAD(P)-dependent dehydrogenase (short-subunit alcohol dehydrogenase family)